MQSIMNVDCDRTMKQEGTESSANYCDCGVGSSCDIMDNSTSTYRLAWKNHLPNYVYQFQRYFNHQCLTDVTLACEGQSIKCHKLILSTSSSYFMKLLAENSCDHPIIILHGLKFSHVKHLLSYMYKGEVKVSDKELPAILKAAETLRIKGLCPEEEENNETFHSPPPFGGNSSRNPNSLLLPPPQMSPPLSNQLRHEVANGVMSPPLRMDQQPLQNPSSSLTMPVNYNNLLNLNNANSELPFWMSSIFQMLPGPGPGPATGPTGTGRCRQNQNNEGPPKRRRRSNSKRSSSPYSKAGSVNSLVSDFVTSPPPRNPVSSSSSSAPSAKSVESIVQDILTNMKKNSTTKGIIASDINQPPNEEGSEDENGEMTISKAMDTPSPPPNAFCNDSAGGSPPKSDDGSSSGSSPNRTSKNYMKRYKRYNHDDLVKAIQLVREKGVTCIKAALQFNIPSRTLYERVKKLSQGHTHYSRKSPTTSKTPDLPAYLSGISNEDLVKMLHFQSSTQAFSLPLIKAEK